MLALGAHPANAAELRPWTDPPPPLFSLPDSQGQPAALGARQGDLVLVHFFATWCEPCREELPALSRLAARSKVKVVAISVDEPDLRVRRFVETMSLKFPVLLDRDRAVARAWTITTLPSTVVLDAALRPRLLVETEFAWDTVDPAALLAQTKSAHPIKSESITTPTQRGG